MCLRLEISILDAGVEARTVLLDPGKVTMAKDLGIGVIGLQSTKQSDEGMLLSRGAGVGRMAELIEASLVDDAKGAPVVAFDMDALDALREQGNDTAVVADIVVVGALAIFLQACVNQGLHAERLVAAVGHAVHDEILHNF